MENQKFKIGKLFHLTHVVNDIDAVDKWYNEVFAVKRFYRGYEKLAGREASLIAIGDVIMEPMMPAQRGDATNRSVAKFHERFGQHFHSIAWYVDDVGEISTQFDRHGFRLFNIVGKAVKPPHKAAAIWTHPRETPGQLEFALAGDYTKDPRLEPGWSSASWREQHPLGIERASHITVVVKDMPSAKRLYRDVLGGKVVHEEQAAGRKESTFVAIGEDTVVELARPLSSAGLEGREIEANGAGIYALTFKTRDLAKAGDFLRSKGLRPDPEGADSIVLGKDQAFGMVVGFTRRALPNDPR
jgi:catechol 2,3-dioxygenase-like lactoylglutathione lyase family enzyme